jgi:outer membrane protein assembly factor BamD (BamD/ComL family)
MRTLHRIAAGLLLLGLTAGPGMARADEKSFDQLYSEAVKAKKQRRFQDAISKFAQAKTQVDASDVHRTVMAFWGLGTTYELMRDCRQAISIWEEYIKFAEGKPGEAGGVKNANQKIDVCKKQLDNKP